MSLMAKSKSKPAAAYPLPVGLSGHGGGNTCPHKQRSPTHKQSLQIAAIVVEGEGRNSVGTQG